MTDPPTSASPLRDRGIYTFRGRDYSAVGLGEIHGRPWEATALIHWRPGEDGPRDIIYLRHADGTLLSVVDFAPIGTVFDLTDTGRTDPEEDAP